MDLGGGIDVRYPLGQDLNLGAAQGRTQGRELAVDVGLGDMVHIDQGQAAQGAPCQSLYHPGADTADADDGDVGQPQPFQPGAAIEGRDAAEAAFRVHHAASWRAGGRRSWPRAPE
jgi:hypothetical protein